MKIDKFNKIVILAMFNLSEFLTVIKKPETDGHCDDLVGQ
jgi:hypothetical protein